MTFKVKAGLQVGATTVVDSNSYFQQTESAASVMPSLALNFTSKALDPRVTFTRSTAATFVGSNGLIQSAPNDTPRFNHDPITRICKGLLFEPTRTNLITYSADWTTYHAIDNTTTTANTVLAPDGTLSGTTLTSTLTGGNNNCWVQKISSITSGTTTYQYTQFIKQGTCPKISINLAVAGGTTYKDIIATLTWSNLSVTYAGTDNANGTYTLEAFPNGWYRFGTKLTDNNTGHTLVAARTYVRDPFTSNVTGEYNYIWGAQVEVGTNASTSYIPTVASQVARNNDITVMQGNNFFNWYNATEGTFVVSLENTFDGTLGLYPRVLSFSDGSGQYNNIHVIYAGGSPTQIQTGLWTNGVFTAGAGANKSNTSANSVIAMGYQLNNTSSSFDGAAPSLDTTCPIPTIDRLHLGNGQGSGVILGHLKSFTYYPERLDNNTLTNLSS